jgi:hypothetical protein
MNHLRSAFFGTENHGEFIKGIQHAINNIGYKDGIYTGDNLFTYHRNLSFLTDEKLMASHKAHAETEVEHSILWRIAVVAWGAYNGLRLGRGDFVECACYKGTTARIVCDYLDFQSHVDRHYYLYDLFEHDASLPHHAMPEHSEQLYDRVKNRFADMPNVTVTQGRVPEILSKICPKEIAFLHLDMNNAQAEIGALEVLFDRMLPGAVLVLDDYGWLGYREQKLVEDPWLQQRGYRVLELPTGQGLLIK